MPAYLSIGASVASSPSDHPECRSVSGRRSRFKRRRFKPKKNIFSGAWTAIYLTMGLASWLVWRQGGLKAQFVPLCVYLLQLGVNLFAWPPIFVGASRRRYAFADALGRLLELLAARQPDDVLSVPAVACSTVLQQLHSAIVAMTFSTTPLVIQPEIPALC